jgi:pimeloyl-ACP methyl ester carboxylesterase
MRVYAPDLPGFGRSQVNGQKADVPSLAASLNKWMATVGLGRAVVVANSFGCQIAAHLAASYPQRVRELVLLGPVVEPSARNLATLAARGLVNALREPPSLAAVIARDLCAMGVPRALALLNAMFRDHIEDTLPAVCAPTVIVRGERDPLVSQRWAKTLVRRLADGKLAVIPGAAHALNYNAPDQVASLVRGELQAPLGLSNAS